MKKIILISPPYERFMGFHRFYYHIGIASLAAVLDQAGHDVLIYDADYNPEGDMLSNRELMSNHIYYEKALNGYSHYIWSEIKEVVKKYDPDFIGISVLSLTLPVVIHLIKLLREICPGIPILTGGSHATLCPEDLVEYSDYVLTNEGEMIINDVISGYYNKGIISGIRVTDLDSLPFPAIKKLYNLQNYDKKDLSIVMSSRGCPNSCKFCNSSDLWKCKVIQKSPEYFMEEIKHLMNDYAIKDFFITDDTFTFNKKWLNKFLDYIKPLNITWRCFSRVNDLTEEVVLKMKNCGCRNIKLGIESGSQRILDMVDKNIKLKKVLEVSKMLKLTKMSWSAYFIIGFPGETIEDIKKTQDVIKKISANSITVNVYTPLPKNRIKDEKIDYMKYSFHSPNNNFTGCISDDEFYKLVKETINIAQREYNEHII